MSDNHREAALKHLVDSKALLDQSRPDGAAYLSGYVVECSLKALCLLEGHQPTKTHSFTTLLEEASRVASFAGARSARYLGQATRGVGSAAIAQWRETIRYEAPHFSLATAQGWHDSARVVFEETVHQMRLDGVI